MGFEVAAIALGAVAAAAEVGKGMSQISAADAKEHALDEEALETRLQTQQKTLSNYDVMQKVLDAQEAEQTIRGTATNSPSFNAFQRNTINIGARRQQNIDIEGDIAEQNIATEKRNVRNTLYADLFGDFTETASAAFGIVNKMPKMKG